MVGIAKHECPHPLCTVRIPNSLFACNAHWMALPMGVRIVLFHSGAMANQNSNMRRRAEHVAREHWQNGSRHVSG